MKEKRKRKKEIYFLYHHHNLFDFKIKYNDTRLVFLCAYINDFLSLFFLRSQIAKFNLTKKKILFSE